MRRGFFALILLFQAGALFALPTVDTNELLWGEYFILPDDDYVMKDSSVSESEDSVKLSASFADEWGNIVGQTAYTYESYGEEAYYERREEKIITADVPVETYYSYTETMDDGSMSYSESYSLSHTKSKKHEKQSLTTTKDHYSAESESEMLVETDYQMEYSYFYENDDGNVTSLETNYEETSTNSLEVAVSTLSRIGYIYSETTTTEIDLKSGEKTVLVETQITTSGRKSLSGSKYIYDKSGNLLGSWSW